jgi:uncharacterized protein (DUF1786 family)
MDTGSAAALGSLEDPLVQTQTEFILCNIGNFHTLAFHIIQGRIVGIFEHHTGEISKVRLEELLVALADGSLSNDDVFYDSGHGALVLQHEVSGRQSFPFLSVTGPRRALLRGSYLKPYEAVPLGDMMLAGNYGLLRAFADREPAFAPLIKPSLLNIVMPE